MSDLPAIERLEVIELRPGDTIVVSVPRETTMQELEAVRESVVAKFPGHKVIVKARDVELKVIHPDDEP